MPIGDREAFRETGRRLVNAMARHVTDSGAHSVQAERDAVDLAALLGERLAANEVPLADAVSMFVAARRPFLAEVGRVARRRDAEAGRVGQLYDVATGLLDRLLLAFVAAHALAERAATETAPAEPAISAPTPAEPSPTERPHRIKHPVLRAGGS